MSLGSNSETKNLTIGNTGGSNLSWDITELNAAFGPVSSSNSFSEEIMKSIIDQPKGVEDSYHGPEVISGIGGPDAFGYVWIDSDEPGGPVFNWAEISSVGTLISTWTNGTGDDGSVVVPLPFSFSYYGTNYSQLKICTNGWVSLDAASTNTAYSNIAVPNSSEPNNVIYAFWDDLDVRTSGGIYYYNDAVNNRFIIQYNNVPHYSTGGPYTFQIILYNDGRIFYQYLNLTTPLNSNTIGFENTGGTDGIQMVFDNTYAHNNLAVKIEKGGLAWLSENPISGLVSPGGNQNVDLLFNSLGLALGTYTGKLRVASNDPLTPLRDVKVRLNVVLSVPSSITLALQGYYNTSTNKLNINDTARIYLRNISAPYSIVDSSKGVIDSVSLTGSFLFTNAPTGTYYLQVRTRNGLETWSKAGGESYVAGSPFSYDFTSSLSQAYGNKMILKGSEYCLYSGDANQEGVIDLTDIIRISNDASTFLSGYAVTDINGDRIVDLTDIIIAYNNSSNFISKSVPPGAEPSAKNSVSKFSDDSKKIENIYESKRDKGGLER